MAEPTSAATATLVTAGGVAVPMLTMFGVPLGLRIDLLVAGFAGSLVAMALLNSVPSSGDTLRELMRTSARRIMVAIASSLTAGYLTPMAMVVASVPPALVLGTGFFIGVFAQAVLMWFFSTVARLRRQGGLVGGGVSNG